MRSLDITNFPKDFGFLMFQVVNGMKPTFENILKSIATIGTLASFEFMKDLRSKWLIDGNDDEPFDMMEVIEASMKFGRYQLFDQFGFPVICEKKKLDDQYERIQSKIDAINLELENPRLPECAYGQLYRRLDYFEEIRDEFVANNDDMCFQWISIVTWVFVYRDDFIGPKLIPYIDKFRQFEQNFERTGRIF